ncbi:MAG TPA: hypothetical protein VF661_03605 [Actinomycetales bacterium]
MSHTWADGSGTAGTPWAMESSGLHVRATGCSAGSRTTAVINGFYATHTGFGFRVIVLAAVPLDLTEWWWGWQKGPAFVDPKIIDVTCDLPATSGAARVQMRSDAKGKRRVDSDWWVETSSPSTTHLVGLSAPGLGLDAALCVIPNGSHGAPVGVP